MDIINIIILHGSSSSGKSRVAKELETLLNKKSIYSENQFSVISMTTFFQNAITEYHKKNEEMIHELCDKTLRMYYIQQFDIPWSHQAIQETFISLTPTFETMWNKGITNMISCIREHIRERKNLIVELILATENSFESFINEFHNEPIIFIKVDCDLETIKSREKIRENRPVGWASIQYPYIHTYKNKNKFYDFDVNTLIEEPTLCAQNILDYLNINKSFQAMKKNYELINDNST